MSDDDRDDKPEKFEGLSLLGPEPIWHRCGCGELTSRVPCWECDRKLALKIDAARDRGAAIASIPRRYAWATVESPELVKRVKGVKVDGNLPAIIRHILAATRVIFVGPSGAGKTSLACACLRERLPHGIFMTCFRLGMARAQAALGQGEPAVVDKAMNAPLLLLDEVGGEAKTATNAVRDVLFARHDADLPTWITTGFTGKQLSETYGDGALRRITEDAFIVRLGHGP